MLDISTGDRYTERWAELLKQPILSALRWFQRDSPASPLWEGTPFPGILGFVGEQSKGWDRRQLKAAADHAFELAEKADQDNRPRTSINHLFIALAYNVLADDLEVTASAIGNLGMAFGKIDDYQRALRLQEYALLLKQRIGKSQEGIARSHRLIGEAFAGLGNYTDARKHTVQAKDIFASIPGLSRDAEKLGMYIEKLDNIIVLKDDISRSVEQLESNEDFASCLQNAETFASNQDDPKAALEYAKAIGIAQRQSEKEADLQAHLALAKTLYGSLGLFQEAYPHYQTAAKLARLLGQRESECTALLGLARTASEMGRFDEAREALETTLIILAKDQVSITKCDVMALLSVSFLMEGHQNDGETYLKEALSDAQQIVPVEKAVNWFLRQGRVFRSLDFIEEAIGLFQAGVTLAEKESVVGEKLVKLYQNLGNAYTVQGMQGEAISAFHAGITSAEAWGNHQALAWSWNKLGWAFVSFKDYRSVGEALDRAGECAKKCNDPKLERNQSALWSHFLKLGATEVLKDLQVSELLEVANDPTMTASVHNKIISLRSKIALVKSGQDEEILSRLHWALASMLERTDHFKEASQHFMMAFRLARLHGQLRILGIILNDYGTLLAREGRLHSARRTFAVALACKDKYAQGELRWISMINLAHTNLELGRMSGFERYGVKKQFPHYYWT